MDNNLTLQQKRTTYLGIFLLLLSLLAVSAATFLSTEKKTVENEADNLLSQSGRCTGFNRDGTYFRKQHVSEDGREFCRVTTFDRPGGNELRQAIQSPCRECR